VGVSWNPDDGTLAQPSKDGSNNGRLLLVSRGAFPSFPR
jgi:hypothetical protein